MDKDSKIYIAGHRGLVGSAILRNLKKKGFSNLILKTKQELDLLDQKAVAEFFEKEKPEYVFLAAAKVGGIKANMSYPANFLYENLQIQNNIIWSALNNDVKKLLFLGSSCIYPKNCPQPIKEEYLLTGTLEPTNEGYSFAKISGIKLCEKIHEQYNKNFISCMPTNIYGENDNFNTETSHVIPALIKKMHEAKINNAKNITIWGSGEIKREFLYVDDLAEAIFWLMENYDKKEFINIGTGVDISIKELAYLIKDIIKFNGELIFDPSKPDGAPRKLLNVNRLHNLGWKHKINLKEGIEKTYKWYLDTYIC